jgi:hypothetical protein
MSCNTRQPLPEFKKLMMKRIHLQLDQYFIFYLTTEKYQGHVLVGGFISNDSHSSDARATGCKEIE